MDPNENLKEQVEIAKDILLPDASDMELEEKAVRLAELVVALDEWIQKGGFLPEAWKRP
jgi:hypothetical protein